jgi:hypothetical protein
MQLHKIRLESYARIDEKAHISGVALIPRISRNNNLYTKEELKRFNNVKVPLNWEHDRNKEIGFVTFHYNAELETVYYDGFITDESAAQLARNKTLFTSIEAEPVSMKDVCNGGGDCFHMPFGLVPQALALTETPGVPETSVNVIERYLKECEVDHDLEKHYETDPRCKPGQKYVEGKCVDVEKSCNPTDIILNKCDPHETREIHAHTYKEALEELKSIFCPHCGELKKKNK